MTTREVLINARRILKERGRTTATLVDSEGCVCPLGAIALALGLPLAPDEPTESIYDALEGTEAVAVLGGVLPVDGTASDDLRLVWHWNDAMESPKDNRKVYAAFDRAIKAAS